MGWLKWSVLVCLIAVGVYYMTRTDPISELDVQGVWEPQYQHVADTFRRNLKTGFMRGASFAAYVDGKPVVNIWGGYTDEQFQLKWKENTISHVASTTKLVAALAFSTLLDKGYVKYDDLVSKYWPEFAQNGKDNVTVNMLISHQAGLYALDKEVSFKDIVNNPDKVDKILAAQKPFWPPGTEIGYHSITIGMYVDFLARKIDPKHRPIYQIYEEDFRIPLDLDFYMATPYAEHYRIARPHMASIKDHIYTFFKMPGYRRFLFSMIWGNPWVKNMFNGLVKDEWTGLFGDPELRNTPIPAASGIGTAVSIAKLTGLVAARKAHKGKQILSDKVVQKLNTPSLTRKTLALQVNATVGHGTYIYQNPWGQNVFGQPGAGGQMGYVDPTNKVGLAFITNFFCPFSLNDDLRFVPLEKAFYECLGKQK